MTMIDVDTSPLEAAREWRGIGLVATAMNAGLPVAQAQALEDGDPDAFGSIDEMIAAAVVYGATIGIGRDEAVALLDRTACRTGPRVELPDVPALEGSRAGFSDAVQTRGARIARRSSLLTTAEPLRPDPVHQPAERAEAVDGGHGGAPGAATARPPLDEIALDHGFGAREPWERDGATGELEAWAGGYHDVDEDSWAAAGPRPASPPVASRAATAFAAALERVLGTDRADEVMQRIGEAADGARALARDGRERLRRSEHATLILAVGGGAILIALLVALGGALGGGEQRPAKEQPAAATEAEATPGAGAAATESPAPVVEDPAPATPAPERPRPLVPPGRLTLDVYNAGSRKGYAKEVAAKLDAAGYRIGEVTNAQGRYTGATIIHPRDLTREARLLARRSGVTTLQVAPGTSRRITIVVV